MIEDSQAEIVVTPPGAARVLYTQKVEGDSRAGPGVEVTNRQTRCYDGSHAPCGNDDPLVFWSLVQFLRFYDALRHVKCDAGSEDGREAPPDFWVSKILRNVSKDVLDGMWEEVQGLQANPYPSIQLGSRQVP